MIDWRPLLCASCGGLQVDKPPPMELPRIEGYDIVAWIGGGGMGDVFLARELALDRFVSLKVVSTSKPDENSLARFRREAEIAAKVQHPAILQVFTLAASSDVVYYTMPYVPGPSMDQAMRWSTLRSDADAFWCELLSGGDRSESSSADIEERALPAFDESVGNEAVHLLCHRFAELARGLHAVHSVGAVHRDIKPGNILIAPDGHLKLTDFGLALVEGHGQITRTGVLTGTPTFMSPEQVMSHVMSVDHRTDIYSLGLTLYCCLVGSHPFQATNIRDLFRKITMAMPARPTRLRPGLSPELEAIVLHALEKNPEDRYVSAKQLANDLNRFTHFEPIVARPVALRSHLNLFLKRHRAAARVLVVALTVALLVACVVFARDAAQVAERRSESADLLAAVDARLDGAIADADWALRRGRAGDWSACGSYVDASLAALRAVQPELERARELDPENLEVAERAAAAQVHRLLLLSRVEWMDGNRGRATALLRAAVDAARGYEHLAALCAQLGAERKLTYEGPGGGATAWLVREIGAGEVRVELQEGENELPAAGVWELVVRDDSTATITAPVRILEHRAILQRIQVPITPAELRARHPDMVLIPGGIAELGVPLETSGSTLGGVPTLAGASSTTANQGSSSFHYRSFVHVPPFLVARTETTIGEYLAFVESTQAYAECMAAARQDHATIADEAARSTPYPAEWGEVRPSGLQLQFPVTGVSVVEAAAYARWKGGRLPTDSEWEKAARGVGGDVFPWGHEFLPEHGSALVAQWPVGTRELDRSPYGVRDVLANAAEWVESAPTDWLMDDEEWGRRGDAYLRGGDLEAALEAYRNALALDPDDLDWATRIDSILYGDLAAGLAPARSLPRAGVATRAGAWVALRGAYRLPPVPWVFERVDHGRAVEGRSGFRVVIDFERH